MSVKTVKKWASIIVRGIGVLLLLGFLLLLGIYYLSRGVKHYSACEVIEFQVADDIFRVPPKYIWSTRGIKGCKAEGVNLHVAYPDMQPITKAESATLGLGIEITFLIGERGPTSTGSRAFAERQGFWQRAQPEVFHELWVWTPGLTANRQYVMPIDKAYDMVSFSCDDDKNIPYPSCRGFYNYSDKISVYFAFSKEYLSDWKMISERLVALIDGFKVTQPIRTKIIKPLGSGLAVTVEVKTGQRRIIEFLLSPVMKAVDEGVRER